MYIRITKNSRGEAYYHLKSFRRDGRAPSEGAAFPRTVEGDISKLAEALINISIGLLHLNLASSIDVSGAYLYGPLLLLQHLADQSGISNVLSGIAQKHDRLQFNFERSFCFQWWYQDLWNQFQTWSLG